MSEENGWFLLLQNKYSKSLSSTENLNFPPKTVNNLFKSFDQDSDLEFFFWRSQNSTLLYKDDLCMLVSKTFHFLNLPTQLFVT